jgi:hypothetical protein
MSYLQPFAQVRYAEQSALPEHAEAMLPPVGSQVAPLATLVMKQSSHPWVPMLPGDSQ